MTLSEDLLELIQQEFALDLNGIHGLNHWLRVRENGQRLAGQTGADPEILELFAYLHDSKRQNDGWDLDHGRRAAEYVESLPGSLLLLSDKKLELLVFACAHHSDGLVEAPITVQACWDADRLDLGRIGIRPNPDRLCTLAAQDPATIEWAFRRSQGYA
jgi:uncharacterized protein